MLRLVEMIRSDIKSGALSESHGRVSRRAVMLVFKDEIMEARRAGLTVKAIRLAMMDRTVGVPCYERFLFYVKNWEQEQGLRPLRTGTVGKSTTRRSTTPTGDELKLAGQGGARAKWAARSDTVRPPPQTPVDNDYRPLSTREILDWKPKVPESEADRCE